jgi:hypothetical protein
LAEPFVDESRHGLERVGTAEKGLYVIYAPRRTPAARDSGAA